MTTAMPSPRQRHRARLEPLTRNGRPMAATAREFGSRLLRGLPTNNDDAATAARLTTAPPYALLQHRNVRPPQALNAFVLSTSRTHSHYSDMYTQAPASRSRQSPPQSQPQLPTPQSHCFPRRPSSVPQPDAVSSDRTRRHRQMHQEPSGTAAWQTRSPSSGCQAPDGLHGSTPQPARANTQSSLRKLPSTSTTG